MEFLNGGDLMYHIQDKGRFELYRAMYVRALCRRGTLAECTATLPFILPPTPTPPPPWKSLSQDRACAGDTRDTVGSKLWLWGQHRYSRPCRLFGRQPEQQNG